jgi:hypothetical protein
MRQRLLVLVVLVLVGLGEPAAVIRDLGERARPLLTQIQTARKRNSGTADGRYRDWMFSMFVGLALDQALTNLDLPGVGSVP